MKSFAGKVALVVGADGKLGGALAGELAARGAHLALAGKHTANLEALDDRLAGLRSTDQIITLAPLDLTAQPDLVNGLGSALAARFGHLDLAFFCAAERSQSSPAAHLDPNAFARVIATNLCAHQRLIASLNAALLAAEDPIAVFFGPATGETLAFRADIAAAWAGLEQVIACWNKELARPGPLAYLFRLPPLATPFRAATHPGLSADDLLSPCDAAHSICDKVTAIRASPRADPGSDSRTDPCPWIVDLNPARVPQPGSPGT